MRPQYPIAIFYSEEDRAYVAQIPELDDCWAFGHSPEEALDEVLLAQQLWLEDRLRRGGQIPVPRPRAPDTGSRSVRNQRVRRAPGKRLA
jgi:predicted RNase H-like HicB family nuclease